MAGFAYFPKSVSSKSFTGTLIAANWVGATAPYVQTLSIPEIKSSDDPIVGPVYSGTNANQIAQKKAASFISNISTGDGVIVFTCFKRKPTILLEVHIKVVR